MPGTTHRRWAFRAFNLLSLIAAISIAAPVAAQTPPWWQDAVFYQIFVRSFYDSDGDGIGDLNGVIERLDYLNDGDSTTTDDLGITGIWLMPIMPSPSYHGYDVIDYREIEPDYGTMADFERLLQAAHARGIRIVIDLPFNHTSVNHPWFRASIGQDATYADWYVWQDENPGWRGPQGQRVWHSMAGRYYYALFWEGMPDLNYTNPEVTAEMHNIARFWLDVGVDGFRLDGVKHVIEEGGLQENTDATIAWMADFYDAIKAVNADALVLAEIWSSTLQVSRYIEAGAVDLAFEFDLANAMVNSAFGERPASASNALEQAVATYGTHGFGAFLTNHDQNRVADVVRQDLGTLRAAAMMLLTSPGVPFIYYGEEIGMRGSKPDERIRTPMQWTSDAATVGFTTARPWQAPQTGLAESNVADQTTDPDSLLSLYRDLVRVRGELGLGRGAYAEVRGGSRYVFSGLHTAEDGTLTLILINLDDQPVAEYGARFAGPLPAIASASIVAGEGSAVAPVQDAQGGFDGYKPVEVLPPQSLTLIRLAP